MVKPAGPGVYSATYSNIPVYEFQFGEGLKEHVMRRRGDDWINATHILKAAGFDKPARTRILEREVQKETHEKVQGGYGKYQGTWVPLEQGEALAQRNNIYEKLRTIFEFTPGNISPPPAPKHTTAKPKVPKKPAVPKWQSKPVAPPARMDDEYDNISAQLNDDESMADDMTVASASFMAEDDRYDLSQPNTGHRKRKRDEGQAATSAHDRAHVLYADDLLDYFMLSHDSDNVVKPEPPLNFQPDWIIDCDGHSALHWGAAMGDMSVVKELVKHGATLDMMNVRGETPLMRAVMFTNCQDKQTMPAVVKELIGTIEMTDFCQANALHHAAAITISRQKHHSSRYYLDVILNKMQEVFEPDQIQRIIDARDVEGNTPVHIAAKHGARKCVRALIGRGASTNILNNEKLTAEDYIRDLQNRQERVPAGSSSPYAPNNSLAMPEDNRRTTTHLSEAAMSIESKIMPMLHEKFQDLAASFDEEFTEKEDSEKAAQRILRTTLEELHTINNSVLDIQFEENTEVEEHNKVHLSHLEAEVTSLVEEQQRIQLSSRIQHELSKSNGHAATNDDDLEEQIMLAKMLQEAQNKRVQLVDQYIEALSLAGAGEKGDTYRKLIAKCVGTDIDMMDEEILDSLIEQLRDDQAGREGETVNPDEL